MTIKERYKVSGPSMTSRGVIFMGLVNFHPLTLPGEVIFFLLKNDVV